MGGRAIRKKTHLKKTPSVGGNDEKNVEKHCSMVLKPGYTMEPHRSLSNTDTWAALRVSGVIGLEWDLGLVHVRTLQRGLKVSLRTTAPDCP